MCGSDGGLENIKRSSLVYVYDNEPRNKEIVGRIENCINKGERVIIWPSGIIQKDINDMVMAGHDIMPILRTNIYSNLEAKIKFNNWKKI